MISDKKESTMQTNRVFTGQPYAKTFANSRRGSILVFLIVLMVISSILGIGMVSMFSSSTFSIFSTNAARRAQYLSESGLRYTFSELRNAPASARVARLNAIDDGSTDGKWFHVSAGAGRFQVRAYPYWSRVTSGSGNSIAATVDNSGFSTDYAASISSLAGVAKIHNATSGMVGITNIAVADNKKSVAYTLATALTPFPAVGEDVTLALPTLNAAQTITKGSAATPLMLTIGDVRAIPQKNGEFIAVKAGGPSVDGKLFAYKTARLNGTHVQLENVTWLYPESSATFPPSSDLVFSQTAGLEATGEHGSTRKLLRDYATLFSGTSTLSPQTNFMPPTLTTPESGFTSTLGSLDLSASADRVVLGGYVATGGTHTYWARFQRLGSTYSFPDPEETACIIGSHVAPVSTDIRDNLRNVWIQYHQLSYDVQIKVGWDYQLNHAAQGIVFRWHESPDFPGKYQGYGISFMRFDRQTSCSGDMIPNSVKPGSGNSLADDLLLVLWEQKVNASGVEEKEWLAHARLGKPADYTGGTSHVKTTNTERSPADPDQKVTGNQGVYYDGRVNDNATLVVRVEDAFVDSIRVNRIKLFYADASAFTNWENDSRTADAVATNKQRSRYYPKWLETGSGGSLPAINPRWPSNLFEPNGLSAAYWQGNGTTYDFFTLSSQNPTGPYSTVSLTRNTNPKSDFTSFILLDDDCTIQATDHVLTSFPSTRQEIGLSAMGNLRDVGAYPITVAFDDFYIQILGGY